MKKILYFVTLLCVLSICFTACNQEEEPQNFCPGVGGICPFSLTIRVYNAEGVDLLDPRVPNNWVFNGIQAQCKDKVYDLKLEDSVWQVHYDSISTVSNKYYASERDKLIGFSWYPPIDWDENHPGSIRVDFPLGDVSCDLILNWSKGIEPDTILVNWDAPYNGESKYFEGKKSVELKNGETNISDWCLTIIK